MDMLDVVCAGILLDVYKLALEYKSDAEGKYEKVFFDTLGDVDIGELEVDAITIGLKVWGSIFMTDTFFTGFLTSSFEGLLGIIGAGIEYMGLMPDAGLPR